MLVLCLVAAVLWRRSRRTRAEAIAFLREQSADLVGLPGRLRRLARDPRIPHRARWWLLGLALYVASPIDPLPDFIPVIGQLDALLIVPLVLGHVRRTIPDDVWHEHVPPRQQSGVIKHHDSRARA